MSYDFECYCKDLEHDTEQCVFCEMETNRRLDNLGAGLSDAGALCQAFALGEYFERAIAVGGWRNDNAWAPGCQKAWP